MYSSNGHPNRFDQPADKKRDADAFDMLTHLMQCTKIHLDQYRDDDHPDQQTYRQIDVGQFHPATGLKNTPQNLPKCNTHDDTKKHPGVRR